MNKIYQRISRRGGVKYKLFIKIVPVKSDRNYQEIQFLKQLGCEYRKKQLLCKFFNKKNEIENPCISFPITGVLNKFFLNKNYIADITRTSRSRTSSAID